MSYSWIACRAVDGTVITELPGLEVPKVGVTLCSSWTGQATLPLDDTTPQEWRRATAAKAAYLVLLDDGDGTRPPQADPVWGGMVTVKTITQEDTVTLNIATMEAYLSSRYLTDLVFTNTEQCALVGSIVTQCVLTPRTAAPIPPAMLVDVTPGTTTRHREYSESESKTVASALEELAGVDGGPEWTISWRHLTGPERYVPVLRVADRIGAAKPAGMPSAAATFSMPGSVVEFSQVEDWTEGKGATSVVATSTADGSNLPMSAVQVFADPERPTLELRYSPSTSITDIETLRAHAARALAVMSDGAVALTLTAATSSAPRLGVDWGLGDDIGWSLACRSISPGRRIEGDPGSAWLPVDGIDRCIGWELSVSGVETVTPILATKEQI